MYSDEELESLHLLVESFWCLPRTPRSFKTPDKAARNPKRGGLWVPAPGHGIRLAESPFGTCSGIGAFAKGGCDALCCTSSVGAHLLQLPPAP